MNEVNNIRLFLTDVDGCLTDGGMYYSANGEEMKRFCVVDGMGMVLLRQAGIACGILTSETTPIVEARARKLQLDYLYQGVGSKMGKTFCLRSHPTTAEAERLAPLTKKEAAEAICQELGITLCDVCFVGDDVNDLDLLRAVGHPACPANARPEIKAVPGIYLIPCEGGNGAIRHLCDLILNAKKI